MGIIYQRRAVSETAPAKTLHPYNPTTLYNIDMKVFVGLSGGVDSSIAALLLKEQGYDVTGVYMKNWTKSLPGLDNPWKADFEDAKQVAKQLGIPFKIYDFEKDYFDKVVRYMIDGFKAGFTPNPDIMCNQEIKFKLLLEQALEDGADFIATGHYANTKGGHLYMAKDLNKDQTYFLYSVDSEALKKTIFPLGELTKPEVRKIAEKAKLTTATKKESMGICFVGKVRIKDFLSQYVKKQPGDIVDQHGKVIGQHEGAIYYTIGQRHGLDVGGGLPYYVTGKDMDKNEVYVTTDISDKKLWSKKIKLTNLHWIDPTPNYQPPTTNLHVRTRHRSTLIPVRNLEKAKNGQWFVELDTDVLAVTPGQSTVFYSGQECLGGGIVAQMFKFSTPTILT